MLSKLGNASPLFANVRKWVGSLLTSGLLHSFPLVNVKGVCVTEWTLHLQKFNPSPTKLPCEDKSWRYCINKLTT